MSSWIVENYAVVLIHCSFRRIKISRTDSKVPVTTLLFTTSILGLDTVNTRGGLTFDLRPSFALITYSHDFQWLQWSNYEGQTVVSHQGCTKYLHYWSACGDGAESSDMCVRTNPYVRFQIYMLGSLRQLRTSLIQNPSPWSLQIRICKQASWLDAYVGH
jgi:hypothetical protein